jgi:hypothetical protein
MQVTTSPSAKDIWERSMGLLTAFDKSPTHAIDALIASLPATSPVASSRVIILFREFVTRAVTLSWSIR